jgi:stearoyl-CoA desaturase (delta-9 desaturase)
LPFTILIGPVHGAIINWYAHKFGYKNFTLDNTSRNLFPVDILMLGESYHNDHHHNPSNINFGVRWFEIDPVYYVILLFQKLGIVQKT